MKVNKLFLVGAIALGVMSCTDEDKSTVDPSQKGNTYASVSVTLKSPASRGVSDSQVDGVGTADEQKLETLDILSTGGNQELTFANTGTADGTFWFVSDHYLTAPWPTQPGSQTLALLFNKNTIVSTSATTTGTEEYTGEVAGLITPNFTMTSKSFPAYVFPNISKDVAANGSGLSENVFTDIEVERVVAKGIVVKAADYNNEIRQGTTLVATISGVTFAAVNGAKKTFLYRDNAGSRTMETTANYQYTGFTSAIHALAPVEDADAADAAGLVRLGVNGVPVEVATAKSINDADASINDDATNVFYFMENSGDLSVSDMKEKGYYRFAYAKVYAVYTPESVLEKDGELSNFVPKTGTGKYYKDNGDETYAMVDVPTPDYDEGYLVFKNLKSITITEGTTFYKGAEDGILYASIEAAVSSKNNPGQSAYTYTNGKCGYRALWNRQIEDGTSNPEVIVNADARRNNAYMLSIKGFAKLGFPWDESDPNDPNLPKPDDDDDPELPNPTDPNIEPTETYMRVEAVVLPWNLVQRGDIILQ